MKAVLMAAGVGNRISRHIDHIPKSTLRVPGGQTLIQYTVSMLEQKGVRDITVAVGYRGEMVRDALRGHTVSFVDNPFYHVTNSIASAWFARDHIRDDDLILMNADTYLEERIFDHLIALERSPVMLVDTSREYSEIDYKVQIAGDVLRRHGKELEAEATDGEYVGAARISREQVPVFSAKLESMISRQESGRWWENVLYELSTEGTDVFVSDVRGAFWAEVDYIDDYRRIQRFAAGAPA